MEKLIIVILLNFLIITSLNTEDKGFYLGASYLNTEINFDGFADREVVSVTFTRLIKLDFFG